MNIATLTARVVRVVETVQDVATDVATPPKPPRVGITEVELLRGYSVNNLAAVGGGS